MARMIGTRTLVWLAWLVVACAGTSGRGAPDAALGDSAAVDVAAPAETTDAPTAPEPSTEVSAEGSAPDLPDLDEALDVMAVSDAGPEPDLPPGDTTPEADGADLLVPSEVEASPESQVEVIGDASDAEDGGDEGPDAPGEAIEAGEPVEDVAEPDPEPGPEVAPEGLADVQGESDVDALTDAHEDAGIDAQAPDAADDVDLFPACPLFYPPVTVGQMLNAQVNEASGVVESRRNPGILWVHNDSGDLPRLYALLNTGALEGTFLLAGTGARDWEDLAIGPGPVPGVSYLYVGDIGDNGSIRADIRVVRIAEPAVTPSLNPPTLTLAGADTITLVYPDHAHNAETLLVDPLNGDLYVVVKAGNGVSPVFRAAAPHATTGTTVLAQVATLTFGVPPLTGNASTTGGDISPSGDLIAIRTYSAAYVWRRAPGATIAEALATEPCPLPLASEGQGEALGFAADGQGYYTVSEGGLGPLSYYERK